MTGDPVSWLLIERGWKVLGVGGDELATVDETVGDSGRDIFNGLVVSTGLLKAPRYVPAERVTEVREGEVRTDLASRDELPEWSGAPESAEIRPD